MTGTAATLLRILQQPSHARAAPMSEAFGVEVAAADGWQLLY